MVRVCGLGCRTKHHGTAVLEHRGGVEEVTYLHHGILFNSVGVVSVGELVFLVVLHGKTHNLNWRSSNPLATLFAEMDY